MGAGLHTGCTRPVRHCRQLAPTWWLLEGPCHHCLQACSRARAPAPTSTPKIGHRHFPPHINEPPTSLRTYPPAHPAYGLCSDSFEHLERWLFDSFGLHRAAQGVRLCVQLSDQLSVRPIGSDRPVRAARAGKTVGEGGSKEMYGFRR